MIDPHPSSIVPAPNNLPYLVAVVVMVISGVTGAVLVIALNPSMEVKDKAILIGLIFGFLAPTTLSLLAFMKAQETHLSVNSRLDAFMSNATRAAHADGITQGRQEGRQLADARTDALSKEKESSS